MPKSTPHHDPRLRAARELADGQGGVVSRRQLYAAGVTRWEIRGQVRARRWQLIGDQSVCLHNGPIERRGHLHAAVFQGGPRAVLDGASALEAAGLERFDWPRIRVTVPRGTRVRRTPLYDIRQSRRWRPGDRAGGDLARTREEVAAVRGALWAFSDRQACLLMTMAVQQGIATAEAIAIELLAIRRDRRRTLLHDVVDDLLGGVRALGELDFATECRRRGLPEPTRQVVRKAKNGRYYLDVIWEEWGVCVEIDGIHHGWAERAIDDALRHNAVTLQHAVVLRLPVLGLRVAADDFFDQIADALEAGGCPDVIRTAPRRAPGA